MSATLTQAEPELRKVCCVCHPSDHGPDASHGYCAYHYSALMESLGVPEEHWLMVVRAHPRGGYTLAVRRNGCAVRDYHGWWPTAEAAGRALL